MASLSNAERQQYENLRQKVTAEVMELWTKPGSAVAESASHFLLIASCCGLEKCIDSALAKVPSEYHRDESEREFLVGLVMACLNRLLDRPPLDLLGCAKKHFAPKT